MPSRPAATWEAPPPLPDGHYVGGRVVKLTKISEGCRVFASIFNFRLDWMSQNFQMRLP